MCRIEGATSARIPFFGCMTGLFGYVNEGNGIERVGGVGSAVGILGVVGITVVGDDDNFIVACTLGSFNHHRAGKSRGSLQPSV